MLFSFAHKQKHKKNKRVRFLMLMRKWEQHKTNKRVCSSAYAYVVACVASVFVEQRAKKRAFRSFARAKNGARAKIRRWGRGRKKFRFTFCALPIFRAAKTRSLADLDGFPGFPFPIYLGFLNAQERLLRRLLMSRLFSLAYDCAYAYALVRTGIFLNDEGVVICHKEWMLTSVSLHALISALKLCIKKFKILKVDTRWPYHTNPRHSSFKWKSRCDLG